MLPSPWALELCDEDNCVLHHSSSRVELHNAAKAALDENLKIKLGPNLVEWDTIKTELGENLWVATQPRVSIAMQARYIAAKQTVAIISDKAAPIQNSSNSALSRDAINRLVDKYADNTPFEPNLIKAIIRAESNYDTNAVSHKGATGLMQLMPATGAVYGVAREQRTNPDLNIKAGIAYLEHLSDKYDGDIVLALAAYNAGEEAVRKHGGKVPTYKETVQYIVRVMNTYIELSST